MMTELMQEAGLVGGVCPKVEPGGASSCSSHVQVTLSAPQRARAQTVADRRGMKLATYLRYALLQQLESEGAFDPGSAGFIPTL